MTWECYVKYFTEGRYDMILCRGLLTDLGLYFKASKKVIEECNGPYKGLTASTVDM